MKKNCLHPLAAAIKTTVCLGAISAASISFGQNENETLEEEIVVTGSLIKGVDLKGALQAVTVSREDILESGASNISEVLRDLSQTGGGSGTFTTSTAGPLSGSTPIGAAGVSLRGLGTSSTLTLVNGRRVSVSAFANGQESFIDINSIPSAAVERIDVLPSGASATYGADAVAGVVNVILRENYEGAELGVSYADSTASTDEGRYNLNFVWGDVSENGNTLLVVDYYKRNPFFDRDRSFSSNSVRPSQQGIYPSFNDLFFNNYIAGDIIDGVEQTAGGDTTESPAIGGCPADQFNAGRLGQFCEYNTNQDASIDAEYESLGALLTFNLNITEQTQWFSELMFQTYESQGFASPAPFSSVAVSDTHPDWTPEFQQELVDRGIAEGGVIDFDDYRGFPIFAWGRFTDPRATERESESLRIVSGLEGGFDDWNWEVAAIYGQNKSEERGISGLYKRLEFEAALLGNICTDGTIIADEYDANRASCEDLGRTTLWYNPFGGQADQMAGVNELLRTQAERNGESEMYGVDGVLSGSVASLPGGDLKVALGAEFRHESVFDRPSGDAVATQDNDEPIIGFSSTSSDYDRDQFAFYTEAYLPLHSSFDLQLAARYDEYDDFGDDINPKVAFKYQPLESLIFRGNWSTSFRAPSLAQAGAGTLLSTYRIDCAEIPQACNNEPDADSRGLFSEEVGNPNLEPEEATSAGFGVLLTPSDDIELAIDYWTIEHENLIGIDEEDFLRRAIARELGEIATPGMLPTGQAGVEIDDDGFVVDAHFPLVNLGEQETSGVDIAFTYYFDALDIGRLTFLFDATYLEKFDRVASPASEEETLAGEFRYPRWLATSKIRWRNNGWGASLSANYTHSYDDDPSSRVRDAVGLGPDDDVKVSSWTIWDVSLSYDFTNESFVMLNIDNIFDRDPPTVLGSSANVDHINHNAYGAFVKLSYTHVF